MSRGRLHPKRQRVFLKQKRGRGVALGTLFCALAARSGARRVKHCFQPLYSLKIARTISFGQTSLNEICTEQGVACTPSEGRAKNGAMGRRSASRLAASNRHAAPDASIPLSTRESIR